MEGQLYLERIRDASSLVMWLEGEHLGTGVDMVARK